MKKLLIFLIRYSEKPEWECAKVASGFELKKERLEMKVTDLSGGYQMRVKLAGMLLTDPNLLLLDEPTNYLDLSTLILLEQFLKDFRGGFIVITHDREFLKKTCTSTMELEHGKLNLHPEPLEEYLEYKAEQEALAASVNQNIERKQKQLQTFVDRFGAKASKAKAAQSKVKQISKLETKKIGILNPYATVKMYIPPVENKQGAALECKKLTIGYPEKIVSSDITFDVERGKKVAILGDNGQGKSTFLKTIAGVLPGLGGEYKWKANLKIAYYAQHLSQSMNPEFSIEEYVRSAIDNSVRGEEIYRILGNFLFKKTDFSKKIFVLSGGEKARVYMAGMFLSKADVYLLDEPTNHLDFETVEALGQALGNFGGTVFVVSHDRTFVNLIATEIMEVKEGRIKRALGSYEDYVWQLEQHSGKNYQSSNTSVFKSEDPLSSKTISKQNQRRVYELRKEIGKLERKVEKLKNLIADGVEVDKNNGLLLETEENWLKLNEELEGINV